MKTIEIQNINKIFGEHEVLKSISCSISEGEIFGLLGPSGAGKTTLIKILTGQLVPTDGKAYVLGKDAAKLTNHEYSQTGMVMDSSGLYDRLSCYDNLLLFVQILGLSKKRIKVVLEKVGLSDAVKTPAGKLSKGMRQRLVLARAIMHEPKILFLDEPTSGLDPMTTQQIHELIYELRDKGTTVFLTTHDMEEAGKLCAQIALLNDGEIIEYGDPQEICRKYNEENKITILCKDQKELILPNNAKSSSIIADLFRLENIISIHSSEPNLETVFIALTGRGLS